MKKAQILVSVALVTLTLYACVPGRQLSSPSIVQKESEGVESTVTTPQTGTENESTHTEVIPAQVTKDTSSIIKEVAPSVVLILNRKYYPLSYEEKNYDLFPFRYQDKLGRFPAWNIGSGFIVDKSGYIVTNYHVVEGAETIFVFLNQGGNINVQRGKEYIAGLIYRNEEADFALIKISPNDTILPEVTLGDSSILTMGEKVLAIGCPLPQKSYSDIISFMKQMDTEIDPPVASMEIQLRDSYYGDLPKQFQNLFLSYSPVNDGIISAISQSNGFTELQIDRAINRASSGGALVSSNGEVVGINNCRAIKASSDWAGQYEQFVQNTIQSLSYSQNIVQNINVALAINDFKSPIGETINHESPPLISGVYCDVRRFMSTYMDKETQSRTELPPCVIAEWVTDVPTTSQVMYIWNPFECPAIFETERNDLDACVEFCHSSIGAGERICEYPPLLVTKIDKELTNKHKIIIPSASLSNYDYMPYNYEGSFEFKIISSNSSGIEVISDRYRFLWTADPNKLMFLRNTKLIDPYGYHCISPEKH